MNKIFYTIKYLLKVVTKQINQYLFDFHNK